MKSTYKHIMLNIAYCTAQNLAYNKPALGGGYFIDNQSIAIQTDTINFTKKIVNIPARVYDDFLVFFTIPNNQQ